MASQNAQGEMYRPASQLPREVYLTGKRRENGSIGESVPWGCSRVISKVSSMGHQSHGLYHQEKLGQNRSSTEKSIRVCTSVYIRKDSYKGDESPLSPCVLIELDLTQCFLEAIVFGMHMILARTTQKFSFILGKFHIYIHPTSPPQHPSPDPTNLFSSQHHVFKVIPNQLALLSKNRLFRVC